MRIAKSGRLQRGHLEASDLNISDDVCTICLGDLDRKTAVVALPCRHALHKECVVLWFERSMQCPTCRRPCDRGLADCKLVKFDAPTNAPDGRAATPTDVNVEVGQ